MSPQVNKKYSLHDLELLISYFLRWGVSFAGFTILLGWVWMLRQENPRLTTFTDYHPQPLLESLHWAVLTNDRPMLICLLGLGILVTLPVLRVLMTAVLFFKQKELRLGTMALVVFAILVASFLLGIEI
ncbi:MAG: DUF1634 domain-containing protein [Bdellovibrio sp.]|nr:DUF1634 domain-containing protein [Bdellovibrio sp.]